MEHGTCVTGINCLKRAAKECSWRIGSGTAPHTIYSRLCSWSWTERYPDTLILRIIMNWIKHRCSLRTREHCCCLSQNTPDLSLSHHEVVLSCAGFANMSFDDSRSHAEVFVELSCPFRTAITPIFGTNQRLIPMCPQDWYLSASSVRFCPDWLWEIFIRDQS